MTRIIQLAIAATTLIAVSHASAGIIVTIDETGGDVVATGSGTADISLLTLAASGGEGFPIIDPSETLELGGPGALGSYSHASLAGPTAIGSGSSNFFSTNTSGDRFGMYFGDGLYYLLLPNAYVSGDPLSGSATWDGETFASIGLTPGEYTWTWDTATGTDFFTADIVPEPGTAALLGVAGLVCLRRRRG